MESLTSGCVFLALVTVAHCDETCNVDYSLRSCEYGCCGSGFNEHCCTENSNHLSLPVPMIISTTFACLIICIIVTCWCCACCCNEASSGQRGQAMETNNQMPMVVMGTQNAAYSPGEAYPPVSGTAATVFPSQYYPTMDAYYPTGTVAGTDFPSTGTESPAYAPGDAYSPVSGTTGTAFPSQSYPLSMDAYYPTGTVASSNFPSTDP